MHLLKHKHKEEKGERIEWGLFDLFYDVFSYSEQYGGTGEFSMSIQIRNRETEKHSMDRVKGQ